MAKDLPGRMQWATPLGVLLILGSTASALCRVETT